MSIYDIYNHKLIEFISEKKCDLSNSNLSNIDENIFIFTHLEVVDLSENFLVKISENIQKLINVVMDKDLELDFDKSYVCIRLYTYDRVYKLIVNDFDLLDEITEHFIADFHHQLLIYP